MSQVTGPSNAQRTPAVSSSQAKASSPNQTDTKSQPSSGSSPPAETKDLAGRVLVEAQNKQGPSEADIQKARENPNSWSAVGLAQNPNFIPADEDRKVARENLDSRFAWGLAKNLNFKPSEDDRKFARENPHSWFALGLARNPNFEPSEDDGKFARKNPYSRFAL